MTSEYDKIPLQSTDDSSTPSSTLSLEDKHFDASNTRDKQITVNSVHNDAQNPVEQEPGEIKNMVIPNSNVLILVTTVKADDSNIEKKEDGSKLICDYFVVKSQESQSTGSGADSDVEDNVETPMIEEPYVVKEYDPRIDDMLPDTVTLLTTPEGVKLYLIGTAHFSMESQEDVSKIIQAVQPHIVTVELCKARVHVLQLDEKTILQVAENLTFQTVRDSIQQNGLFNGLLYILLLNMSAHLTRELGMAPGGEFRRAFNEAKKVQNCMVHLGDRPINITLQRALSSLDWWQTFKLVWHLLTTKDPISKEEVERCKRRDMLEEMLAEMTGEFPALGEVFVKERDLYLTHSLQIACSPQRTPTAGWKPRVVGVVGIGHMPGIIENWGKVQPSDIVPIMRIPPPSLSSKVIKAVIKVSLVGAVIYVGYKIMPSLPGSTVQSIKSSVEGLLKCLSTIILGASL